MTFNFGIDVLDKQSGAFMSTAGGQSMHGISELPRDNYDLIISDGLYKV